jgi:hypothetical protein
MAKKLVKPTVEEILTLFESCMDIYDPLFTQFDEDESYYDLDFLNKLNLPKEFASQGVILPTASDMVEACVDHTDVGNARVYTNRKGTSATSEKEQEMMRKFYLGLIHRTNVESTISPWRVGAKHFWLHGLAVFKTVWDADRWSDKPEQGKESDESYANKIEKWRSDNHLSIPIVIKAVHPRWIMLDPYEDGGRFVFEFKDELVYDVRNKYPTWSNPKGKNVDKTVEHISFWTPDFRCELYDGEPILKAGVAKHDYGFLPYIAIDTGLGNLSTTNAMDKRYVGILRKIHDLLISESRNYSLNDIVLSKTAWPWGTIEGKGAEGVTQISQQFGTYTPLPDGVKLVNQTPQVPPQALQSHLAITSGYISAHAAPNVVRGMGETGVRSGTDRRLLLSEASTRYLYATEAFKHGTAKILTNCARLMKNVIPGDIRIWSRTPTDEFDITINKDDMKEPFNCYVEFAPVSEEDEYRRHDDLERLVSSKIVTRQWARKQMSNVDPIAMEVEETVEELSQNPAVQQVSAQYVAARMMEAVSKRSAAESINNPPPALPMNAMGTMNMGQGGGQVPQQGTPPMMGQQLTTNIPHIGTPGSAQAVQNQMAKMRSPVSINPNQGQGGGGNRR